MPASDPSGTVFVITDDNTLHAIKPYSGDSIWSFRAREALTETLFIGSDYTIYLFTESNRLIAVTPGGTVRWKRSFNSSLSHFPGASPDGSIFLLLKDKRLIKINGRGEVIWEKSEVSSLTPPIIDSNGSIVISGEDSILYCYSPCGNIKWQYNMDNRVVKTALWRNLIISVSESGSVFALRSDGSLEWENNNLSYGANPVSLTATSSCIYIIYESGNVYKINPEGEQTDFFSVPMTPGFASVDESGSLYIYGKNKKIYKYFNNETNEIISETKMTPPLIGAAGNLISGGENWIVYCFYSPAASKAWSGFRGGPLRNGSIETSSLRLRDLEQYYSDSKGYKFIRLMAESSEIDKRLKILEDFEKMESTGLLLEKYPYAALILTFLAGEGIDRFPRNHSPLVRIKAINLLGKIGDIRTRNFLINHLNRETNSSAAVSSMWALGRIGFDYDGSSTRSISSVKNRFYNDDGVLLTICDSLEEIIYYNGIISDQSALHVLSAIYSSDVPPMIRRRAQNIFEKFTRGYN